VSVKRRHPHPPSPSNIKLNVDAGLAVNYLDVHIEIVKGRFITSVYHKPSHELYHLPFNSTHPRHLKKNIPYAMIIRAIKYSSTFDIYVNERERIRMSLLLNKYPNEFIDNQFDRAIRKSNNNYPLNTNNYDTLHKKMLFISLKEKIPMDYVNTMFIHFTYCSNMNTFPEKFNSLWNKYFLQSPINEIKPILSTRNLNNLQKQLVNNKKMH
jgi:hypothetical protein